MPTNGGPANGVATTLTARREARSAPSTVAGASRAAAPSWAGCS